MTSGDQVQVALRSEIEAFRSAVEAVVGRPLPPLAPPAPSEELDLVEEQLGFGLPLEIRALYSITNRGLIMLGGEVVTVEGILRVLSFEQEMFWEITAGWLEVDNWPVGQVPSGEAVPFASFDRYSIWAAAAGPDEGVIYTYHGYDGPEDDGFVPWRRVAPSLIVLIQASTAVVEAEAVAVTWIDKTQDPIIYRVDRDTAADQRARQIFEDHGVNPDVLA